MNRLSLAAVRRLTNATRVINQTASLHALNVPDYTVHSAVTPFQNGIPVEKVRDLHPWEAKWDFWTSSDAFTSKDFMPSYFGYKLVPYGQTWVLENGNVLQSGWHFLLPMVHKVKAVKSAHSVVSGVFSEEIATKNGKNVEVYAVVYFKVTDFKKSAFYVDPESNKVDSERAVSKTVQRFLSREVPAFSAQEDGSLAPADVKALTEKLFDALKTKESQLGLAFEHVEVRGAFSSAANVPDKIRALEAPEPSPERVGHNLSNDYWADVLSPAYFEKYLYGGRKEEKTPASVSLVWCIPSPPDFHHFNHNPRVCVSASEGSVQKA